MYERLPIYVCARMNTRVQSCVSEKAGVTSTLPACRNGSHTFNVATVSPVLTFKKEEKREKNKNKPTLHGLLHLPGNAAPSRPTFEALEAGEADAWR